MKRSGTTLIEVLTAIFILGLGLVSLLTLFPLGAAQMARAVQDERAAQLAANAGCYFRSMWKDLCERSASMAAGGQPMFTDEISMSLFTSAMDDPNIYVPEGSAYAYLATSHSSKPNTITVPLPITAANAGMQTIPNSGDMMQAGMTRLRAKAAIARPSFPVLVDPIGWRAGANTEQQYWCGYQNNYTPAIAKRTLTNFAMRQNMTAQIGQAELIRMCALLDDMNFTSDGLAKTLERLPQYSCSWMLRRDVNSKRSDVNLTVLVYFKRSFETPSPETVYRDCVPSYTTQADGTRTYSNTLTMTFQGAKPAIRRGSWILDATVFPATAAVPVAVPQATFYRVTEVSDDANNPNILNLQLETPVRANPTPSGYNIQPNPTDPRNIVVLDGLLEVFDKGPMEMNSPSRSN